MERGVLSEVEGSVVVDGAAGGGGGSMGVDRSVRVGSGGGIIGEMDGWGLEEAGGAGGGGDAVWVVDGTALEVAGGAGGGMGSGAGIPRNVRICVNSRVISK